MKRSSAADVSATIREFIRCELMGQPSYNLKEDEPLVSGGLIDSFNLAHIGAFIEAEFGVAIPPADLDTAHMDTLRLIVARVMRDWDAG